MSEVTVKWCARCGDRVGIDMDDLCVSCEDAILLFAQMKDLRRVEAEIRRHFRPEQVKELARRLHWGD